jgi:hypothetical protein
MATFNQKEDHTMISKLSAIIASAALCFSGAAYAHDYDHDERSDSSTIREETKDEARDVKEESKDVAREAREATREAGEDVRAAFDRAEDRQEANRALDSDREIRTTPASGMGELNRGTVHNSLTTAPLGFLSERTGGLGYVTGQGVNVEYMRSVTPKFSAIGGLMLANQDTLTGQRELQGGLNMGVDYFIIGRNNEGLHLGPRLAVTSGGVRTDASTEGTFGGGGELGYSFISRQGITAGAGIGAMNKVIGAVDVDRDAAVDTTVDTRDFDPYAKLNLGYSW